MNEFEKSERAEATAAELIERLPQLTYIKDANPKIAYFESPKRKTSGGHVIHADCEKVKPKMKNFTDCDYMITVYINNILDFTEEQYEVLIFHELLHIDCTRYSDGELVAKVKKHDVNEFDVIAENFGNHWSLNGADCPSIYDVLLEVK